MWDVIDNFTDPGEPCTFGCPSEDAQHWISVARKMGVRKRIVAVQFWSWWDLDAPEQALDEYRLSGVQPVYLYADSVISDSSGRFDPGNWVRTSPLKELHNDVIFETAHAFYVLVGPGNRKRVTAKLILSLMP